MVLLVSYSEGADLCGSGGLQPFTDGFGDLRLGAAVSAWRSKCVEDLAKERGGAADLLRLDAPDNHKCSHFAQVYQ